MKNAESMKMRGARSRADGCAGIERGGLFTALRERHGAAEITEVTRQKVDWQRQAARDLAEGRFVEAVGAFDKAGAITWTHTQEATRKALVDAWTRDGVERPGKTQFVFAYTNRDVNALNAELRQVRRQRGELAGADVELETKHGRAAFAVGDRVQFTDTDKALRIYNGNAGTITGLDARTGQVTAVLDAAAGGTGRAVTWSAAEFEGFRHGYAGTIYKGQGKTLDRTYLYHTEHWRSAASYVALTRQRESAAVFVARDTARDVGQLARQMARGEVRAASISWTTGEELAKTAQAQQLQADLARPQPPQQPVRAPERQQAAGADRGQVYRQAVAAKARGPEDALQAKVREALQRRQRQAEQEAPAEETPREALRRELQALDWRALEAAANADRVGNAQLYTERSMTVQDAARLIDRDYAKAADRIAALRKDAVETDKSIRHYEGVQQSAQADGERRWRVMGIVRQALHKSGARRDHYLGIDEGREQMALTNLAELDPRRVALAKQIGEAEKVEAATFARAEPKAVAELAKRQERGSVAREVLQERRQQDLARVRAQRERNRGRDHGLER